MYNPQKIEKKWQRVWEKQGLHQAKDPAPSRKRRGPKKYILVEFPYPSGEGLHVGHCRPYVALDIVARKARMEKFNVLFPMGWDAFGLPTENYAIRTGIHPITVTKKNTVFFKRQQKSLGLSFDWDREINTTDPAYYKWTQWIFLQFFKRGLAYKKKIPINWCPSCKIGLANEEVVDGCCERCGAKVTKKEKEQWILKITKYAERLIQDLDKVDYPERVKTLEKDWIGRSCGVEIKFPLATSARNGRETENAKPPENFINVFTTRIDTIFGATFLILAPENPIINNLKSQISNVKAVEKYIGRTRGKLERERITEAKEKTGIKLDGIMAINPATGKEIPIFVADYVLMHYGTGAIMGVPAHDQRDLDFAQGHNLPVIEVIKPYSKKEKLPKRTPLVVSDGRFKTAYEGEGVLINSSRFNGMESEIAKERIADFLTKKGIAQKAVHYKLRDWIFSRQHYWGEPIPLVFCENCAAKTKTGWIAVPEKDLPVKLPRVKKYKPSGTGESPLAEIKYWVNTKCPKCGGPAKRETDTMPNWAGSNWYYLRYCDPKNDKKLASPKLLQYWMPVDWYNGGMEHTTLHLLYSRFVYKFLWDIGAVPKSLGPEPYKKRTSHGMILGEGWVKMSKSKGNIVNPDDVIKKYGADTLRIYEMFIGPFEEAIAWDSKGVKGARRFLDKVWKLKDKANKESRIKNQELKKLVHKTIKKVSEDIDNLKLNTAISSLMILANELEKQEGIPSKYYSLFLVLLSPFAPHLSEEIWHQLGHKRSIFLERWPQYDPRLIKEKTFTLVIQVNGKVRDKIKVETSISGESAKEFALSQPKIKNWIGRNKIKKTIFVSGKLINFVI